LIKFFVNNEVLEKLKLLPPEKQREVEDFVEYLLSKYNIINSKSQSIEEKRYANMG